MGHTQYTFVRGELLGKEIAFYVSAIDIALIQQSLLLFGQSHFHLNLGLAAGGQGDQAGVQLIQQEVRIMRICVAIRIQVGMVQVLNLRSGTGDVVQQRLDIVGVDKTVAIEIAAREVIGRRQFLPVNQPGHVGLKRCGSGVQVAIRPVTEEALGKQLCRELISLLQVVQRVESEAEFIFTCAVGIVAQLCLDLAVIKAVGGVSMHQDIRVGQNGSAHIGQTCTLLHNGVIPACLLLHWDCSGHEETLDQRSRRLV